MKHKKKLIALTAVCALLAYWLYPDQHPVYPASDHYDPKTQTFFNPEPQQKPTGLTGAFWKILPTRRQRARPNLCLPSSLIGKPSSPHPKGKAVSSGSDIPPY